MSYSIELEANGIVRCALNIFLTAEQATDYATRMSRLADESRRRHGRSRVLTLSDGLVQGAETLARLNAPDVPIIRTPLDRSAIVTPTRLGRMQANRSLTDQIRLFNSEAEARGWLMEAVVPA